MIKRVFKLKNRINEFDKFTSDSLRTARYDVKLILDNEIGVLKILYETGKESEYIVLIPGDPSFIIIKASEKGINTLLNSLEESLRGIISEQSIREIKSIASLYMILEKCRKDMVKLLVKEVTNEFLGFLVHVEDRDLLEEIIRYAPEIISRTAIKKL